MEPTAIFSFSSKDIEYRRDDFEPISENGGYV